MEKKLRHLLSIAAAAVFIIMAMASFGPDTSTHLEVLRTVCVPDDIVTVRPEVEVVILDDLDRPIIGQPLTVFTTQQKINDLDDCLFASTFETYNGISTDAYGICKIPISYMVQNNHGDLIRVEVKVEETVDYTGARVVKVLDYGDEFVNFLIILKDKSVL